MTDRVRLDWITARSALDDAETFVPEAAVRLGRTVHDAWRQHLPSASTNGLASGNTRAEAIVHGLCEVIERDVLSGLTDEGQAELVDASAVKAPYCAALLERLAERGCWWELRHVPNRYGVAVMCCHLWREDQSAAVVAGSGAHPDPGIALSRAITEAAQTRLTLISGSREDNQPLVYRPGPHRAPAPSAGDSMPWPEIASHYGAPADTDTQLAHDMATAVTTATGRAPLVVDLTWGPYARAEFAMVKVCGPIPALHRPAHRAPPEAGALMSTHVFAGPTITAARITSILPGAVVHPPVQHGDLLRLRLQAGDRVLIIDGLWHQSAPVRHKEILMLLAKGVAVYGASSMGALRAAELAPYGMVGIGRIYRAFRSGLLDADDDVAVLQEPDGRPLTQALVNLRAAFEHAADAGRITEPEAQALTETARRLPYGRRTRTALGRLMAERGVGDVYARADIWGCGTPHDLKRQDAETALRVLAKGPFAIAEATAPGWSQEPWQTSFIRYWSAAFAPATASGLPFLPLLQHQQLYDPAFPRRWRTRVLSLLLAADGQHVVHERAVEDFAAHRGLALADLTDEQLAYWLTADERSHADPGEQLVRLVVRSARLDDAWPVYPVSPAEAGPLFNAELPTEDHVLHALQTNAAALAEHPGHSIAHLSADRISAHLLAHWGQPADAGLDERDAAARDRGLRSFTAAVETDRTFYLGALTSVSSAASLGARVSART
ncbi:YcaO-like family protein [Streptomyces spiramyceticus]|uniref:YcaO-like family protein n=1 Tax=Streptomyces spiramyceticus TaxID=299717 RepID=UPI00237ADBEE|nr:YcaO-like family protein [Streptomyces spiramyceticus]